MTADRSGFTLIEVVTAVAIASLVLLAITTTLFTLNRAHEKAAARMDQQRALRNTIDLLRREISSTLYNQSDKLLRFQVQDRDYYGRPASNLQFATIAPPLDSDASDQLLVNYRSEEQGEKISITRSARDYFLQDSVKSNDYPLLEQLDGFLVECHDGTRWVKSWDTELTKRLPGQVRITLTMPGAEKPVSFQLLSLPRIQQQ